MVEKKQEKDEGSTCLLHSGRFSLNQIHTTKEAHKFVFFCEVGFIQQQKNMRTHVSANTMEWLNFHSIWHIRHAWFWIAAIRMAANLWEKKLQVGLAKKMFTVLKISGSTVLLFLQLWSFETSFLCSCRMSNKLELLRSLYKESHLGLDSILQEVHHLHHLYRVKYIRDKSLQTFNYTYLILCRYQSRWYKWSYN